MARKPIGPVRRLIAKGAATRAGAWYFVNAASKVDPFLLRVSRGWLKLEPGTPILLLRVRGAKSGKVRETPLVYAPDGERMVIVASRGGDTRHPAWYHNLRANPDVEVIARRRSGRYVARVTDGEERERLWRVACAVYPGYETYQQRAGDRRIPVVALEPAGS